MKIADLELFLKNALPCGYIHVSAGRMPQELLDESIRIVSSRRELTPELQRKLEGVFSTALKRCEKVARKNRHSEIYSSDIREYFSPRVHNREIDKRCSIGKVAGNFNPEYCKIKMGEVVDIHELTASVTNEDEERDYRTDFVRTSLKVGNNVSLHHDYIVEILDQEKIRKYFS